jgi:CRISPR system Cascade subunit CasD
MAVRADRPGRETVDFHTVRSKEFLNAQGKNLARNGKYHTIITYRTYLQDALFTVALSGDKQCLQEIANALNHPKWPIYLGRKSCVPSRPVLDKITEEYGSLSEAIRLIPFVDNGRPETEEQVLIEMDDMTQTAAFGNRFERADKIDGLRKFRSRTVVRTTMERSGPHDIQ